MKIAAKLALTAVAFTMTTAGAAAASVIGAFPAPPMGKGPGKIALWPIDGRPQVADFGSAGTPSGNSFYIAYDSLNRRVLVPTVAGTTYIINARTGQTESHFATIPGGRVAAISPDHHWLLVLSGKQLAEYALSSHKRRFLLPVGGNALVFDPRGHDVFVGGNMDKSLTEVHLPSGKIVQRFPVHRSGDLAWAHSQIFSADIKTGVMSILNPRTGRIIHIKTGEMDPNFNYAKIPAARAGFMQLAVSPHANYVYAAGFSGHILRFSSRRDAYLGQVAVSAGPGANKLSGLAVLPGGRRGLVTVENRMEAVIVQLDSGKIWKTLPGVASNRWLLASHGRIASR